MTKEINYYNELKDNNGYVYSLDRLRMEFHLDKVFEKDFYGYIGSIARSDIRYQESFKHYDYKHLWTINYDKSSMTIGYSFNGNDMHSDMYKGFIDVNPNKVGSSEQFWKDYNAIKSFSKYFNVVRCDIAIDIPIKRERLLLVKGNKKYQQISHSNKDKSECLGKRNRLGFIRVYNKTMESKLEYDLSRIEVTCLLSSESFKSHFPKVYDISKSEKLSDEMDNLNDTQKAIVEMANKLIASGDDSALIIFNSMGRGTKKKLKDFITPIQSQIIYSEETLNKLIDNAQKIYL